VAAKFLEILRTFFGGVGDKITRPSMAMDFYVSLKQCRDPSATCPA